MGRVGGIGLRRPLMGPCAGRTPVVPDGGAGLR